MRNEPIIKNRRSITTHETSAFNKDKVKHIYNILQNFSFFENK